MIDREGDVAGPSVRRWSGHERVASAARRWRPVFIAFFSSFGPGGPPSSIKAGDRWHRFGSPCGSLRDQILASLESAFGRDRNHFGCCVVLCG
ncbi:hypothetical protein [Actinomadura luteofluorescens]|uniref:hypothetical protein n=1 Tax=Actinomadura luteofluorescens TaxID=46163 RepID=UPI0021643401|nr:hypothetical protein [Actinomadura glauciflava]